MCVCAPVLVPPPLPARAELPEGISDSLFVDRSDLVLEAAPFAAGGFAQIYRGTYKQVPIALKEIHAHLVATPERCECVPVFV